MKTRSRWTGILVLLTASLLIAASCSSDDDEGSDTTTTVAEESGGEIAGLFGLAAGECADGEVTAGSSFRMVQSGGTLEDGPFLPNPDSSCGDPTWLALSPGSDGGLITGEYQPAPDPAFGDGGNGLAALITEPVKFNAVDFAISTEEADPADGTETAAPTIVADDAGALTGELSSVLVSWNGQQFNQGSPKPDGTTSGGTTEVEGTYDAESGEYTLDWSSEISGGPFDGFTGVWHLEGVVETA